MANPSQILNDRFWRILEAIDRLEEDVPLEYFLEQLGDEEIDPTDLSVVISFLGSMQFPVSLYSKGDIQYISPPPMKSRRVFIDLSFSQWVALQAHFPLLGEYKGRSFHQSIATKLAQVEATYPQFDLFRVIEEEKEKQEVLKDLHSSDLSQVKKMEEAINSGFNLELTFKETNTVEVYAHKVVFIDGVLSLIGEDVGDRCLVCFQVDDIKQIKLLTNNDYTANFSSVEIEDFISALRAVSGKEERLVLKVSTSGQMDLKPPYHFLGNPYVTSNMEGDMIWGASVEVSDDLFEWLLSIKDQIEILDPQTVKEQFELFCQEREGKKPLKKAS